MREVAKDEQMILGELNVQRKDSGCIGHFSWEGWVHKEAILRLCRKPPLEGLKHKEKSVSGLTESRK